MTTTRPAPALVERQSHDVTEEQAERWCRRGLHRMEGDNIARSARGGRQCRACKVEAARLWRERNAERVKESNHQRYLADAERRRQYDRDRRQALRRCRRGHVQDGATVYTRPDGRRECRRCRRARQRVWRARHKEA
ncbi:hypothetical protein [Kocuria kalidii]|uniref:hypothetical protein n=1 Tax=Kocuria kalidii TaxID=3376283 RepID=UPI0037B956BF